jgi:hypothetical protein
MVAPSESSLRSIAETVSDFCNTQKNKRRPTFLHPQLGCRDLLLLVVRLGCFILLLLLLHRPDLEHLNGVVCVFGALK